MFSTIVPLNDWMSLNHIQRAGSQVKLRLASGDSLTFQPSSFWSWFRGYAFILHDFAVEKCKSESG